MTRAGLRGYYVQFNKRTHTHTHTHKHTPEDDQISYRRDVENGGDLVGRKDNKNVDKKGLVQ